MSAKVVVVHPSASKSDAKFGLTPHSEKISSSFGDIVHMQMKLAKVDYKVSCIWITIVMNNWNECTSTERATMDLAGV